MAFINQNRINSCLLAIASLKSVISNSRTFKAWLMRAQASSLLLNNARNNGYKLQLNHSALLLRSVLWLSCLLLSTQPLCADEELDKKLERAKQLIDSGKPAPAKLILREVIRINPRSAEAHMQLGAALASLAENDKYDEAIGEEKKAIELDPKSSGARRILGMIFANQKKYDEAISLLKESCALNPSSFAAQRDLAATYSSAGKTDESIAAFKKAIELNPKNVSVRRKLASAYLKQNNYADSIKAAKEAVSLNEKSAESHLLLANTMLESGDAIGSIDSFKTAIEHNGFDSFGSKNPFTAAGGLSGLGWATFKSKGDAKDVLAQAVLYQKKAIKAFPSFLPAHVRLAELTGKQGKPREAESMYQKLLTASDNNPAVAVSYSRFLISANRRADALDILTKALEKSPGNKQVEEAIAATKTATAK